MRISRFLPIRLFHLKMEKTNKRFPSIISPDTPLKKSLLEITRGHKSNYKCIIYLNFHQSKTISFGEKFLAGSNEKNVGGCLRANARCSAAGLG